MVSSNKKVVFISHYGDLYGANLSLLNFLMHSSIPKANMVVIVPETGKFIESLSHLGIKYIVQAFSANIYRNEGILRRYWNAFKKLRWLLRLYILIKRLEPSIIYSNSSILYYGVILGRLLKVPHLWHLREFGILDFQLYPDFGLKFQKYLLRKNTFNIAISKSISKYYELEQSNSEVVYNGVTTATDFVETCKEKNFDDPLRFGVVGAIIPYKGQLLIVKAFHQFLNTKKTKEHMLHLIGVSVGTYLDEIKTYIEHNGLEKNIIIEGHLENRAHIYSKFDVLINCAKHEGFGRTTVEAMGYGIVPIGFNHSGTAEIIQDQVTGVLFNSFDVLPSILTYFDENREALRTLQKSMRANFNPDFLTETYCGKLDDIITKQLQKVSA